MSIEIRRNKQREYECEYECEFGIIEYADPRPDLSQVGPLMVTVRWYIGQLRGWGPILWPYKGNRIDSASVDGSRIFIHIKHGGKNWTWEIFDAHMADGFGPDDLVIGRWPD